jgi:hypothetical protein
LDRPSGDRRKTRAEDECRVSHPTPRGFSFDDSMPYTSELQRSAPEAASDESQQDTTPGCTCPKWETRVEAAARRFVGSDAGKLALGAAGVYVLWRLVLPRPENKLPPTSPAEISANDVSN